MKRVSGAALSVAGILALATSSSVLACPPPPAPPGPITGETIEAFQTRLAMIEAKEKVAFDAVLRENQKRAWDQSVSIFVAQIDKLETFGDRAFGGMRRAWLIPNHAVRGPLPDGRFAIADTGLTDCGGYGGGEAVDGRLGDSIVVFLRAGRPSTVITSVSLAHIREPRLRAALNMGTN